MVKSRAEGGKNMQAVEIDEARQLNLEDLLLFVFVAVVYIKKNKASSIECLWWREWRLVSEKRNGQPSSAVAHDSRGLWRILSETSWDNSEALKD